METVGNLRKHGVTTIIVDCGNAPHCYHHSIVSTDGWPDDTEVPLMGRKMRCAECGHLGAETRPNHSQNRAPNRYMPPGMK